MSDFLHMGGYALYVWASYGLTLIIVLITLITTLSGERATERRVRRLLRREQK